MPFVLDASVALAWATDDEDDPVAARALALIQNDAAHVPAILWFELRNGLVVNERRRRITQAGTQAFLARFARLSLTVDRSQDEATILGLARQHGLPVYDASYLELARRESLPLATLDRALLKAARSEGVPLVA